MADPERDWTRDPDVARAMQILAGAKTKARAMIIEANLGAERVLESRLIRETISQTADSEPSFVRIERNGKPKTNTETSGSDAAGL